MNAERKISILNKHLLLFLLEIPLSKRFKPVYQDTAEKTTSELNKLDVNTAFWPLLSPDFHITENEWAFIKCLVRKLNPKNLARNSCLNQENSALILSYLVWETGSKKTLSKKINQIIKVKSQVVLYSTELSNSRSFSK